MPKLRYIAILLMLALAQFAGAAPATQPMLPSAAKSGSMPLLPYLDYYLDESGSMDIEEIAAPELADTFAPFSMEKLPAATGVLWLRFTIAPLPAPERSPVLVLDVGPCAPGTPMLYEPEKNELSGALEWREISPENRNTMLLPEAGQEPVPCYLRLDGLPGLWFSPIVRTPMDAASNWNSLARPGAVLALGVVMFICLLRGMTERGQWRVWTALYVFFALIQALAGMPSQVGSPGLWGLAAILSPGIALMLLPHVGRHLLRARQNSRALDIQLLLLSLPGAAFALLPLVPGWSWLDRWLDLWPAATLIFVPTALAAWLMGLSGSRRFLLACLVPPFFVGAGIIGLYFGVPANLLASAPLWGVALGALLLAATRAPNYGQEEQPDKNVQESPEDIINLEKPLDENDPGRNWNSERSGIVLPNLGPAPREDAGTAAMNDPNLRLIPADEEEGAGQQPGAAARPASGAELERAIRAPLDEIMREGAALEHCSLPPSARKSAENMLAAAHRLAGVVSGAPLEEAGKPALVNFNLQQLLRDAHDAVAPAAENAGIGLGWFMPPYMPQLYRGVCGSLGEILGMLLESSVRATTSGSVHLSARRVPDSPDPGHILFTITDSGSGFPPAKRSSVAFDRAWELVGAHNGQINMECGAQGTTINFSLHFTPLEEEIRSELPLVAVLCENPDKRREIVRMLAPLDLRISENSGPEELLRNQREDPAGVLVVSGKMAAPAASDMLREFVALARDAGFGTCKILAVHSDNSQDRLLAASGFTHAIPEPLDTAELRTTVLNLVEYVGADYLPPEKAAENMPEQSGPMPEYQPAAKSARPVKGLPDEKPVNRPRETEFVPDEELLPEELLAEAEILARAEIAAKKHLPLSPDLPEEIEAKEIPAEDLARDARETAAKSGEAPTRANDPDAHPAGEAAHDVPGTRSEIVTAPIDKPAPQIEQPDIAAEIGRESKSSTVEVPEDAGSPSFSAEPEPQTGEAALTAGGDPVTSKAPRELTDSAQTATPEAPAMPEMTGQEMPGAAMSEMADEEMAGAAGAEMAGEEMPATDGVKSAAAEAGIVRPEAAKEAGSKPAAAEAAPIGRPETAEPVKTEPLPMPEITRPEAAGAAPEIARPEDTGNASAYVSHWVGGAGEWVGEPVPITKKAATEAAPGAANAVAENATPSAQTRPSGAGKAGQPATADREMSPASAADRASAQAGDLANERADIGHAAAWSKSPASAVEWVGEPMPISPENRGEAARPAASSARPQSGQSGPAVSVRDKAASHAKAAAQNKTPGPDEISVPGKMPESGRAAGRTGTPGQQESNNLIADFMSKTISQVSSTLERLTRGSKTAEKPAEAAKAAEKPAEAAKTAEKPVQTPRYAARNPLPADGGARPQEVSRPAAESPAAGSGLARAPQGASPQALRNRPSGIEPGRVPQASRAQTDPFILQLVDSLDRLTEDAKKAYAMGNPHTVADCAARISEEARQVGLRKLSQMAEYVMRAGQHGDMEALGDLLPELVAAVERNRITMTL